MLRVINWLYQNWQWLTIIMVLLIVLSLTGSITNTLRSAKEGLKQLFTPLGFIVLLIIVIIVVVLIKSVQNQIL